jgi:hypothetical protein
VIAVENRQSKEMSKLVQSTLFSLFYVFASLSASAHTISKEKNDLAIEYIDALPQVRKILIPTTWRRTYEILGSEATITKSIGKYEKLGYRQFYLSNYPFHLSNFLSSGRPQISIISISSNQTFSSEIGMIVAESRLLPAYKEFLSTAPVSPDGCTVYKFTSRETWASIGVITIGLKEIEEAGDDKLEKCIHGALDYINGFPLPSMYFNYSLLPDSEVRGLIMEAIGQCAKEGATDMKPPETTKDGITALPSLSCVRSKIGQ